MSLINQAPADLAANVLSCQSFAIIVISAGDQAAWFSPGAAQLLERLPDRPAPFPEALPPALCELARLGLAGNPVAVRQVTLGSGGSESHLEVEVVPLPQHGAVLLLKRAGAATPQCDLRLRELYRLATAGMLAASMAHEVKNALVACKTMVDLLLEKQSGSELASIVKREVSRIDLLVTQMLRLAAPGTSAQHCPVSLGQVIGYVGRLLETTLQSKQVKLDQFLEASPDLVNGSEQELQQAVLNLILNAFDAVSQGGRITLRTSFTARSGIGNRAERRLCFTISDDGAGIPAELLPRLFEPFFTTKPAGTGLGLAITRRIVEDHGGRLTASSTPGVGSCFEIQLPVLAAAGERAASI